MYQYTNCVICHKKGFFQCKQCPSFVCSKEHLFLHNKNTHKDTNIPEKNNTNEINNDISKEIMIRMSNQDYSTAITLINNHLNLLKQHNNYNLNN